MDTALHNTLVLGGLRPAILEHKAKPIYQQYSKNPSDTDYEEEKTLQGFLHEEITSS